MTLRRVCGWGILQPASPMVLGWAPQETSVSHPNFICTHWKLDSIHTVEVSSSMALFKPVGQIQPQWPWLHKQALCWGLRQGDSSNGQMSCVVTSYVCWCVGDFLGSHMMGKWGVGDVLSSANIFLLIPSTTFLQLPTSLAHCHHQLLLHLFVPCLNSRDTSSLFKKIFQLGGMWDLKEKIPWPGGEPVLPVLEAWSLKHWTPREVLEYKFFIQGIPCHH